MVYHKVLHGGISRALNIGISLATAKYIARQESDDEWMPWHLDFLLNELELNDKLDIIGSKVDTDKISYKVELKEVISIIYQVRNYGFS